MLRNENNIHRLWRGEWCPGAHKEMGSHLLPPDLTVTVPPRTRQCTAETSSQVHDPRRQIHSKTQHVEEIVVWDHAHRVHRRGTRQRPRFRSDPRIERITGPPEREPQRDTTLCTSFGQAGQLLCFRTLIVESEMAYWRQGRRRVLHGLLPKSSSVF